MNLTAIPVCTFHRIANLKAGVLFLALVALHTFVLFPAKVLAAETVPEFAVVAGSGAWRAYTRSMYTQTGAAEYTVNDAFVTATLTNVSAGRWTLRIAQAKQSLKTVYFPWQAQRTPLDSDITNDLYYYPFLLGRTEKAANHNADWTWWGLPYPGSSAAPLVVMADPQSAKIVAATNWPAKTVTPLYAAQRMVLRYDTPVPLGSSATFGAIIATVTGNAAIGDVPWQKALDLYRAWLDTAMGAVTYPSWMWDGQGLLDIQLEGFDSLSAVDAAWRANKALYPWLLMWGQMSPRGGGCCGIDPTTMKYYADAKTMHGRWATSGLPAWTRALAATGAHVGYYSAPYLSYYGATAGAPASGKLDTTGGLAWLTGWTSLNASYGANTHYFDVLAREHFGNPASVRALFASGSLPAAALSEGIADVYPIPGLASGSLAGGALCGAPHRSPETRTITTFPPFVRYLLGDRLLYWGWQNDDFQFWGVRAHTGCDYAAYCANGDCDNGTERQIFLTGSRIALGTGARNATIDAIVAERQRVNWWARRPRYLATRGLNLTKLRPSSRVEVTHFRDTNNAALLAISNPRLESGLSVSLNGVAVAVPAKKIAIVDLRATGGLR